jgi:hypothetical protein
MARASASVSSAASGSKFEFDQLAAQSHRRGRADREVNVAPAFVHAEAEQVLHRRERAGGGHLHGW